MLKVRRYVALYCWINCKQLTLVRPLYSFLFLIFNFISIIMFVRNNNPIDVSTLNRVQSVLRSTMSQNRLSSFSVWVVETDFSRKDNLYSIIVEFAMRKARKEKTLL